MNKEEHPFTGIDMLRNSMHQLVDELRSVGSSIAQAAKSMNNSAIQQASRLSAGIGSTYMAAMSAASGAMMIPDDVYGMPSSRTSMFKEMTSRQFNKPSYWARDLYALAGFGRYTDMHMNEVRRYAAHNMTHRLNMAGINTGRTLASGVSLLGGRLFSPYGLAAGYMLDEYAENKHQEKAWWGYLDRVGRSNALLGKGGGVGWNDGQLKDMSRWLSTQDKKWYSYGMNVGQEDLQSTVMSAEMKGYFYKTVDTSDFKRRVTKLISDTKEIMKTMKMASDEAAAIVGELSYSGIKSPAKTIKEMNTVSAMTGLSFADIKNYGMEYASEKRKTGLIDMDTSMNMAMTTLRKYDKKTMGGSQIEMREMERYASSHGHALLYSTYNPVTNRMVFDQGKFDAYGKMTSYDRQMQVPTAMRDLLSSVGGDHNKYSLMLRDIATHGEEITKSADASKLATLSFERSIEPVLRSLLDRGLSPEASAIMRKGGGVSRAMQALSTHQLENVAKMYSERAGVDYRDAMDYLKTNVFPNYGADRRGASSVDDMASSYKLRRRYAWDIFGILGKADEAILTDRTGYTGYESNMYDAMMGSTVRGKDRAYRSRAFDMSTHQMVDSSRGYGRWDDPKVRKLSKHTGSDFVGTVLFNAAMDDPKWNTMMRDVESRLVSDTGWGGWKSQWHNKSHDYIYAMAASRADYRMAEVRGAMESAYAGYYRNRDPHISEMTANAWAANRFSEEELVAAVRGRGHVSNKAAYDRWRGVYGQAASGKLWTTQYDPKTERGIDALAMIAYLGSRDNVDEVKSALMSGEGFDPGRWSPQLMADAEISAKIHGTGARSGWARDLVDYYQKTYTASLGASGIQKTKADKYEANIIKARSQAKFNKRVIEYSHVLSEAGMDISEIGARLHYLQGEANANRATKLHLTDVPIANEAFNRAQFGEAMTLYDKSRYSSVLKSAGMTRMLSDLTNPNEQLYHMSKDKAVEHMAKYGESLIRMSGGRTDKVGIDDMKKTLRAIVESTDKDKRSFISAARDSQNGEEQLKMIRKSLDDFKNLSPDGNSIRVVVVSNRKTTGVMSGQGKK